MPVTISDVAKHAGVSIGTVSRVLNNRDRVSPDTRKRVMEAVRALDYQANAIARGLAIQRTNTVGLIIPQVRDPFFFEVVRGVEEVITASDYNLIIVSQARNSRDEHQYLRLFKRGNVDAMILVALDIQPYEVKQIVDNGIPVTLIQTVMDGEIPTFVADNYGGACALTKHLLGHGYQRFAYISGTDHTPDNAERLRGLRDTLFSQGVELADENIVHGTYLREGGYQPALKLLELDPLPEVIFAANDQMAYDALQAISEQGLRVPDDIALVGFDDIPFSSYTSPALTTVHQPVYEMGWQAARATLDMIESDRNNTSLRVTLPTKLIIRESCGCL